MFNLTVDEAHTFYVGVNGWLVHNTACDPVWDATLAKIRANLERQGVKVWDDDEAVRFLDWSGSEAKLTAEDLLVLRPGASKSAVLEELIHLGQIRSGRFGQMSTDAIQRTRMEIEAKQILIGLRNKYGIPNAETQKTINQLRAERDNLTRLLNGR